MGDAQIFVLPAVAERTTLDESAALGVADVIDVSRPAGSERTVVRMLVAWIGAVGLALLFPLVILAMGVPLVFAVRGLLAVLQSLLANVP
jgi:hypothetical protein